MKTVLVIDNDSTHNWFKIFSQHKFCTPCGKQHVQVQQCGWHNLTIVSASVTEGCIVDITPSEDPIFGSNQRVARRAKIDFVLVRNYPRCVHERDYRSVLLGLNYALLPAVNSLFSIFCATERAILYAELNRLSKEHGQDFPFIKSFYASNIGEGECASPDTYPCVIKVGSSCAGYGKMLLRDEQAFKDMRSVLMMGQEYFTVEKFVPSLYDIRLTQVGNKRYAYKRIIVTGTEWKRNTGVCKHEDIAMTPFYSKILDLSSQLFGGLDIVTVDLLALDDGSEVILEINDSASGFDDKHADDDCQVIAQLVVQRLSEAYGKSLEYAIANSNAAEVVRSNLQKPKPTLHFLGDIAAGFKNKQKSKKERVATEESKAE